MATMVPLIWQKTTRVFVSLLISILRLWVLLDMLLRNKSNRCLGLKLLMMTGLARHHQRQTWKIWANYSWIKVIPIPLFPQKHQSEVWWKKRLSNKSTPWRPPNQAPTKNGLIMKAILRETSELKMIPNVISVVDELSFVKISLNKKSCLKKDGKKKIPIHPPPPLLAQLVTWLNKNKHGLRRLAVEFDSPRAQVYAATWRCALGAPER